MSSPRTARELASITLLTGFVAVAQAQFIPATGSPFAVGTFPGAVAESDFNGDGKLDIVTANRSSNNVSVLLGDGAGGFTPAAGSPFSAGSQPVAVATGDFNGDGKPDVAVVNSASANLTVMLGTGKGSFAAAAGSPFSTGTSPSALVVADFNGDGKADIATSNSSAGNVTVLLGNGSGGFSAAPGNPFAVGTSPQYITTADFNGDSIPDLVTANFGNSNLTLLLGNGSGGFSTATGSPFATGAGPNGLATGDFNGDGKPDVAVANFNSATLSVLLGNGNGGFTLAPNGPFATGRGPTSVIALDVNGDGKLDLVSTNYTSNDATVLLGNGAGGFTAEPKSPFAVGTGPTKVVSGDFNGDGKPDLAVSNGTSANVSSLLNAYPTVTTPVIYTGGIVPVFSSSNSIQSGSWISIYGSHLTDTTATWNGDFPISLGGVGVTIGGKSAYLWFVSPGQINVQAPDDTATGLVDVTINSTLGSSTAKVTLAAASPSFSSLDGRHLAGVILTPNGGGAYGGGTYDLLGPSGAFAFSTRPAKPGETLVLFGVGFGPTTPFVPAGKPFSGAAQTVSPVNITIGGVKATVAFAGITSAGLYQFNLTVPSAGSGDQAVQATVNGARTQSGPLVTVQ